MGILLVLLMLLTTIGCTSKPIPDSGEVPTDFHEEYNENDIPNNPSGPGDWDSEDNLDAMRNVYSLNGQDAVMFGTIIYVDRQGMYTTLLIQKPYQNIVVAAYAEGDIPVIQNDEITVFGRCDGPTTYTNTNEYGVSTEHPTFGIDIRDYSLAAVIRYLIINWITRLKSSR